MPRRATATSAFGVGRRESHDAGDFYARFSPPNVSGDDRVKPTHPGQANFIRRGDARHMDAVGDGSVALVVTSPPYFAGKEYEEALGQGHIPATYFEYLRLLEDVLAECSKKLEPGARMAVNVANLGRKPYRSLSADVIAILQDRLNLLLRGEIIWVKGKGAASSCAWGSFQSAANPVLRDLTERIIIASKGRFDRALSRRQRARKDLPSDVSISKDEFIESTTDVWYIQPESAIRVGHPAPFPVELPERLIHLYTYRGDLVLDPFIGSGTTAVAAVRTGRKYAGYDTDAEYIRIAHDRVTAEEHLRAALPGHERREVVVPAIGNDPTEIGGPLDRAVREGRQAKEVALELLEWVGFRDIRQDQRVDAGVDVTFVARDHRGNGWLFDVAGVLTSNRTGLCRADVLWKSLGKAAVLHSIKKDYRLVFLTTDLPEKGTAGHAALEAARGTVFHDAVEMLAPEGQRRLRRFASGAGPQGSAPL